MDISQIRERIEEGNYDVPAEEVAEALLPWITPTIPVKPQPEAAGRQSPPPSEPS